jgi:hypothetical protein
MRQSATRICRHERVAGFLCLALEREAARLLSAVRLRRGRVNQQMCYRGWDRPALTRADGKPDDAPAIVPAKPLLDA